MDSKDVSTLDYIAQTVGYGTVKKRTDVNAYRFRTANKASVIDLYNRLNGKWLTPAKIQQLHSVNNIWRLPSAVIIPANIKTQRIIADTAWYNVFFDGDGDLSIINEVTLMVVISQKDSYIHDLIALSLVFGYVNFDKSGSGFFFRVNCIEDVERLILKFDNYIFSTKQSEVNYFKILLRMIENQYHYKST